MSPRRGAGEGHIRRVTLKSGRRAWRGWITVGYRANGTPIRRSVQRATRQLVQDALVALKARYLPGLDLEAEATARLHGLIDRWYAHYCEHAAPKAQTRKAYTWAIGRIKAATPGDPLIARLTPLALQDILGRLPADLGPSGLGTCRAVLSNALAQAVTWRLRPDNPAIGLKLPRRERVERPRRTVSAEDAERLLDALAGERLGLAAALTYAVAARPGEIAALRRQDIDLEAGTLTISASHNPGAGGVVREAPKSARGVRTLRYPPELAPWVAQQLARAQNERAMMGERWPAPDEGLIFVRESDGGRLHAAQIYDTSRRVAERLGLGSVGPRILRRSMLSALAAAGVAPKVRAAVGGHTSAITERHYTEVDPAEMAAALALVKIRGPLGEQRPDHRPDEAEGD